MMQQYLHQLKVTDPEGYNQVIAMMEAQGGLRR